MSISSTLAALEASIASFFSNTNAHLADIKSALDVAGEVAGIVAPTSGIAEAVSLADNAIDAVESIAPAPVAEEPASPAATV